MAFSATNCPDLLNKIPAFGKSTNPFLFQSALDRLIGFLHWDVNSTTTRIKLTLVIFCWTYFALSFVCLGWIDPKDVPSDLYIGMWFLIGCGGACFIEWGSLAVQRKRLNEVIQFLGDVQRREGVDDPRRVRMCPWIVLYSIALFAMNTSLQSTFWSVTLLSSSSLAYVAPTAALRVIAFTLFACDVFLIGTMAAICQVTIFTTMFVFKVEFDILGEDFKRAYDDWNREGMRKCIVRHQQLLDMVILFRDKLKAYLFTMLLVYFMVITFSSFNLVIQLKQGDSQMWGTAFNLVVSLISTIQFGLFCDLLESKICNIGNQVFNSAWPDNFRYQAERAESYKAMRRDTLMLLMRSHKAIRFTCGSYPSMSIQTCMKLVQMSYSTFTLLLNVMKE